MSRDAERTRIETEELSLFGDGTRCVHAGEPEAGAGEPFMPGPVFAAPYHLGGADRVGEADFYGRAGNPGWRALEHALGELDRGHCVLFPSGMAAIGTLLRTLLHEGDTLVLPADGYYATREFVHTELSELNLRVRRLPTAGELSAEDFAGARVVLLETPSNPGLDVCDIATVAEYAHRAGAVVAVDNTTATPLGQRPLELGADVVVASDTKAVCGHSDLLLGHVSTADRETAERLNRARGLSGAVPGPFETWLAHRSLATLDLRLERQAANAAALAAALVEHPAVSGVRWPGLPSDPAHETAARQMRRWGGVLRFELPDAASVERMLERSRLVSGATSFGGVHSTADRRAQWGDPVPEGFVRFSAGCEDTEDLVADVLGALD
ncbi:cystathionine gamma-lyase [Actinopolyspora mortivallis]|uniref:cystathionine gamma-lyase n=1 Tax=Actinopolyspora mortivallis TaxID=33906 RepID=UPI001C635645|nr:cystathionine gamma-lyase [Actinopolyspora mortivallis]